MLQLILLRNKIFISNKLYLKLMRCFFMGSVFTEQQQTALWKKMGRERLNRKKLAGILKFTQPTIKRLLDSPAPMAVNTKTFATINDWLLSDLD